MSKKKGLSVEEKRSRMMDFFYEKKDFFQLKELERMCQKEKGITSMSVKDILTSLVDDGMVDTDKIGTSVYFWAFPSKASQIRKRKISDLNVQMSELSTKQKSLKDKIAQSKIGKEESDEREDILKGLNQVQEKRQRLTAELEQYKECDPEVLEQVRGQTKTALEAANRWTGQCGAREAQLVEHLSHNYNIFSTKSWIKKKFCFEDSVIDKQFGLPDDFDYVE